MATKRGLGLNVNMIIPILSIFLGIGLIYYLFFKKGNTSDEQKKITVSYNPLKLTLNEDDAQIIADTLFNSMGGIGTDFETMYNLLQPLEKNDLRLIYNKFGIRSYAFTGTGIVFDRLKIGSNEDLFHWFKRELNKKQKKLIKPILLRSELPIPF